MGPALADDRGKRASLGISRRETEEVHAGREAPREAPGSRDG
jgi:hypothetical protein